MPVTKKKILFVSHDASRTGAPIVLLNFLQWLKQENRFEITVFIKHHGAIEADFKSSAATYMYSPVKGSLPQRVGKKIGLKPRGQQAYQLPGALIKQHFDLVYLNTVTSIDMAPYLKLAFNCPVIAHIHENDFTIQYYNQQYIQKVNLDHIDHFIAVSKSTRDNLITQYGIDGGRISLVYAFISLSKIKKQSKLPDVVKSELNLHNQFVIGGSGLTSWKKGIDLFVQLAVTLNELRPGNDSRLIWVGALSYEFKCQFDYEAGRLGVSDQIIFTGAVDDPQNYFQLFDVFVLTSREDPFPLVALEAAALDKPVLCFEKAGGMPEFIKNDVNGVVVPYGDVKYMAIRILQLMDNNTQRIAMGKEAGKLIENFDVAIAGKQIVEVIDQFIKG